MPRLNDLPLIIAILGLFLLKTYLMQDPLTGSESYLAPPPQYIERFTFGFNLSMSDSLWIRWIQNGSDCQVYGQADRHGTPAVASTANKDMLVDNPRHRLCDSSWSFYMLDAVTKLDPKFRAPYTSGLMILSVMVEDYEGASILYNRALAAYPNDWTLNYQAAYHFLYDVQDIPRAATLLNRAADLGGPSWLKSLASRLYSRVGQLELGIASLESYLKTLTDEKDREKVEARLAQLRSQSVLEK